MKLRWLGHAAFIITSGTGTRIVTDPYTSTESLAYGNIKESAHVVTISHKHSDHNNVSAITGNPQVVRGKVNMEVKGIKIKGTPTFHDTVQGSKRGENTIFTMVVDGITLCHLGDLGHPLNKEQIADIGKVDILLIPVGGFFTIEPAVATELCVEFAPRVIIPMHFKTPKTTLPIADVEPFLKGKSGVRRQSGSELEFLQSGLPRETEIMVLTPAL